MEFACSLTDRENLSIHNDVVKSNPGLSEKELCEVKRAVMLRKAYAWKGRLNEQDKSKEASSSVPLVKDSPSSLLNLGTIKPDAVDLSLSSLSDSEDGSGEESDTAEDGMQDIGNDLLRQRQVSSPTSLKENEYLTGFMRSPAKPQPDIEAKQVLDKDPLSLIIPTKQ